MKLHWLVSHLIVGTIALSMLLPYPALAVKKPFPCWTCCPNGPLCSRDPDRLSYRIMIGRATYYGNTQAVGIKLTSTQWSDLATRVRNWQIEADGNGDMGNLYLFVKWNAATFKAKTFNTTVFVPGINSMGSKAVQVQLAKTLASWTQAERIAYVNQVLTYGIDWQFSNAVLALQAMAKLVQAAEQHPGQFPPVREFCVTAASVAQVFGFISAVALVTADAPLAATMGLIAASAGLAYGIGGC